MQNIVSIFGGHDANITFFNGQYHIIEIERLVKERYAHLYSDDSVNIDNVLKECQDIATKFWGIENDYECVLINSQWKKPKSLIENVFKSDKYLTLTNHHYTHAYSAFYQSPYKEALILSYDGGGEKEYFNFYSGDSNGITLLDKIPINMGVGYWRSASLIKQITERSKTRRSYPGKLMGLAGYGTIKEKMLPHLRQFFITRDGKIADMIGGRNYYQGNGGKNLAEAAVFAAKMGTSVSTLTKMADSLLDIESSIEAQMEAQVLLGRNLNLDKARSKTDSSTIPGSEKELEKRPEALNLLNIYSDITKNPLKKVLEEMEGKEFSHLKNELSDVLVETICPVGKKIKQLKDDKGYLEDILKKGKEKALKKAEENLKKIREIVGLL